MSKAKIISNVYHDIEKGYSSIQKTYQDVKKIDNTITYEDVKKWINDNKKIKPYKNSNSYVAPYARFQYQIDILVMPEGYSPRYALIVIDIFSKLSSAEAMNERNQDTALNKLKIIFSKMGYPSSIYSDIDGAFMGKVKSFLQDEGIEQYTTLYHANYVERFIRTLKNGLFDRLRDNDNIKWTDLLQIVINKYNNTIHSSSKMTPLQAHKDENRINVGINLHLKAQYKRKYPQINIGDYVKIYVKGKDNFVSRKETRVKWSEQKYKVIDIKRDMLLNTY